MSKINFKKAKVALGIITKRVFTGPIEVDVDLTRRCNAGCIMCWYWSPLSKNPPEEWRKEYIPYELFLQLINDFKKLRVKRIVLGGQGEPLLYPKIMEIIETTKKHSMEINLMTGGVHLTKDRVKEFFNLKVDHITVSIQSGTSATFDNVHPGLKKGIFDKIKESLMLLAELKKKFNQEIPKLTLVDVVCNINYHDTVKIIEFGKEVSAETVGFKRLDVTSETKSLLLTQEQLIELKSLLEIARNKAAEYGISTSIDFYRKYIIDGLKTGIYTSNYYTKIPCYVGWLSARILSDGSVIPCCGCYNFSLGNIYNSSFYDIWYSKEYKEFRQKSINIYKNPAFVEKCKCYSCIDFEFNLRIYRKLHPWEQIKSFLGGR